MMKWIFFSLHVFVLLLLVNLSYNRDHEVQLSEEDIKLISQDIVPQIILDSIQYE